eukprot:NODE_363_length_8763_cov_0.834718.p9 type:complete len:106 gc:universal NODE_363_length_8763_cov_0.834718:5986-5669(-)
MSSIPTKLSNRTVSLAPLISNGWKDTMPSRDAIAKEYIFDNFKEAFKFMTEIADVAEDKQHHPEWFNVYNKVQVTWTTHDCQGCSSKDVDMGNFCDKVFANIISK